MNPSAICQRLDPPVREVLKIDGQLLFKKKKIVFEKRKKSRTLV
jgi:hypothetical protein